MIHDSSQIVYINSHNREDLSSSHSNFQYKINLKVNNQYDRVVVTSCSIPKSWYLIREPYNTFTLTENGIDYLITVPIGNYTKTNFKLQVQTLLNDSNALGTYVISYILNPNLGKFLYSVTGQTGQPSFTFNNHAIYEQMGFNKSSTNTFIGDTITSTNVINLQAEQSIFIKSNMVPNDNILQEIFQNQGDFSMINWNNSHPEFNSKVLVHKDDNVFNIQLCDEDGDILEVNGLNINIVLCFYKRNDTSEIHKKSIKLDMLEKLN